MLPRELIAGKHGLDQIFPVNQATEHRATDMDKNEECTPRANPI